MRIYNGPPSGERPPEEARVYEALSRAGIPYARVEHEPLMRVDDGTRVEAALKIDIYKNLFLCNSTKTRYYLFCMLGSKRLNTRALSHLLGVGRLHFAQQEDMLSMLGTKPGAVSILGLIHDIQMQVQLLIDADILSRPGWGCHPCVNTVTLKLSLKDIWNRFLPLTGHTPLVIAMEEAQYRIERIEDI